jgi:hypothetical protein
VRKDFLRAENGSAFLRDSGYKDGTSFRTI